MNPSPVADKRLEPPTWDAATGVRLRRLRVLLVIDAVLAVWYFGWLLQPSRVGNSFLYDVLVAAELFNLIQGIGFWWTTRRQLVREAPPPPRDFPRVDVFIPVYREPLHVVEPTIAAATRIHSARVQVYLLDDGDDPQMAQLAARYGARYLTRPGNKGAKAGNINAALQRTDAPYVVVFDCDHVPNPDFLSRTLGYFGQDDRLAFVQTPQYYANHSDGGIPAAAWAQQALFFGGIARGKDRLGAMFCCGTNVAFRREALESVGGFPEKSVTEDFLLSIRLHAGGWRSVYHAEVLASGLGPENLSAYVTQQLRWSRGCIGALFSSLTARIAWRQRVQYLLSTMYFLTGWTVLVYMSLPAVRILTGQQPLAQLTADQFLLHFAPYFIGAITTVSLVGGGAYTFAGFALAASSYWVHIVSTLRALLHLRGGFVVTDKNAAPDWQPKAATPALLTLLALLGIASYGLVREQTPAMTNNVAFALLHVAVLWAGIRAALVPRREPSDEPAVVAEPGLNGRVKMPA